MVSVAAAFLCRSASSRAACASDLRRWAVYSASTRRRNIGTARSRVSIQSFAAVQAVTIQLWISLLWICFSRAALIVLAHRCCAGGPLSTCPYQKLRPTVLVVQATEDGHRNDPPDLVDRPMHWTVLVQRQGSPARL